MFGEAWPYVDSAYTRLQLELLQAHETLRVQKYECRLRKSKTSDNTTRDANTSGKVIKHPHSSVRMSCPIKGLSPNGSYSDDEHTHKKPSILLVNSIKAEAVTNYSASHIFNAFRGAGTVEDSKRLEAISGSS